MNYHHKISADRYHAAKAHHEKKTEEYGMGMPFDAIPVDLYGGFVPLDKDAADNEERFGLETEGV